MDDAAIARAIHVAAVVVWIGGLTMVTSIILPLVRRKGQSVTEAIALLDSVERRFVWQARIATLLVALSGFYMVYRYDLWSRFASGAYWWMHAMVAVWLIFTLLLFVGEPLVVRRFVHPRVLAGNTRLLALLHRMHWALLALTMVTVLAAVAGSHGMMLGGS
jgi:uncharacterized membrane protein